jgi:hypothetical protein
VSRHVACDAADDGALQPLASAAGTKATEIAAAQAATNIHFM